MGEEGIASWLSSGSPEFFANGPRDVRLALTSRTISHTFGIWPWPRAEKREGGASCRRLHVYRHKLGD